MSITAGLEPGSIDLYLAKVITPEGAPVGFLDRIVDDLEQVRKVLAPHGSVCLELADRYRDDSLTLYPELLRVILVYGTNPVTGRTTERWRARNVVRRLTHTETGHPGDRFQAATTDLLILTGADEAGRHRYFDLEAVRVPHPDEPETTAGAPPLDWWPPTVDGAERLIESMVPRRVCRTCGHPSRRILSEATYQLSRGQKGRMVRFADGTSKAEGVRQFITDEGRVHSSVVRTNVETIGWTHCGHGNWRPGAVLIPHGEDGGAVFPVDVLTEEHP